MVSIFSNMLYLIAVLPSTALASSLGQRFFDGLGLGKGMEQRWLNSDSYFPFFLTNKIQGPYHHLNSWFLFPMFYLSLFFESEIMVFCAEISFSISRFSSVNFIIFNVRLSTFSFASLFLWIN
ncbi:hypothetical protein [Morganella morganii]|uniref:hypothetical protein n=1 Tax=Morganella morganii TaxID=582 RepID=UPI000FD7A731|nr:hypothetical protein [Morganella morganii]